VSKTDKKQGKAGRVTPLMKQYFGLKQKYPDAILLYRVGDFYETFGEDAILVSKIVGIVLTARNNGGSKIELAGFPHHSLELYLPRLVRAGHRVAICEQLEKPSKEKKIVKRGVTEVVTPGSATSESLLNHKSNNYLASLWKAGPQHYGVAFLDVTTGEFYTSEGDLEAVEKLIQSFQPAELLHSRSQKPEHAWDAYVYALEDWVYGGSYGREQLLEHFDVQSLKGFGIDEMMAAQQAAGAILHYLSSTEHHHLQHIASISPIARDDSIWMDRFTIRNLELIQSSQHGGQSLLGILDHTISPMGARLMKKWLLFPLKDIKSIEQRLNVVENMIKNEAFAEELVLSLRTVGDLERLISRVPMGKINPREVVQLGKSLSVIPELAKQMKATKEKRLVLLADSLNPCSELVSRVSKTIKEEPATIIAKGGVIADGVDAQLDEYRNLVKNSKEILVELQQREAEKTGIANLKIGFNNVFGYYLEVTNKYKNQNLIPDNWVRKQTLTNSERYITDELKKLETRILGAEEKILGLEAKLYEELVLAMHAFIAPVQHNARVIAELDCLLSFKAISVENNYVRPEISDTLSLEIEEGRHPVIEQQLDPSAPYIPNDITLENDAQQIIMITGPNMSGKSAILRQTALIVLMAQMGCYVPASRAHVGIIDKIFTRVGASDNISSGESTFMVEMNETASIMNNITNRSLILLDEIGRGTSTFDGISIAWSIAEFLHEQPNLHPKTLFATHYHELNELANRFERIMNYNVATREVEDRVIFLRKLEPGGSKHSFGIHVAAMAGMPKSIVARASEILKNLEKKAVDPQQTANQIEQPIQLSIFEAPEPAQLQILKEIEDLDIEKLTPLDCLMKLADIKKRLNSNPLD